MKFPLWKIIFGIVLLCILFFPAYSKIQKLKLREKVLSQKLKRLTLENKRLAEENTMLKTDPVYIEEVAREKLKVAKENEIIFRVINDSEE